MNNIEIERKFLVKRLPDFEGWEMDIIIQWYLSKPTDETSVRIRRYDDERCYFDIKRGTGKIRFEMGWKCIFNDVKPMLLNTKYIKKVRYKKYIDDILLLVDIFENGLKLIEIESKHESSIDNFKIPDWFGEEVTNDIKYTNNWIAYNFNL